MVHLEPQTVMTNEKPPHSKNIRQRNNTEDCKREVPVIHRGSPCNHNPYEAEAGGSSCMWSLPGLQGETWFPRTKLQAKDSRGVGHGVNSPVAMSPSEYQCGSQQMLQRSGDGRGCFSNPVRKYLPTLITIYSKIVSPSWRRNKDLPRYMQRDT